MNVILQVIASILLICTLLPLSNSKQWWVRVWDFPRLQLMCIAITWLVLASIESLLTNSPALYWWLAVLACMVYQLWWISPYLFNFKREVLNADTQQPSVSILTSNVLMDNRDTDTLIQLVNELTPDILVTLETDQRWQDALDTLSEYPHRLACPLDNKYGMHLYSSIKFEQSMVEYLVEDDIPSMSIQFMLHDTIVRMHGVHPTPPAPGENTQSLERDVELLVLAKHLKNDDSPIIVTGDLNDVAWSKTTRLFRRVSGLLDPRVGRGMLNTFHADHWFMRWPLDHVFLSNHWRVKRIDRLRNVGSDHFPVYIEAVLSSPKVIDSHPELESADKELASDTMQTDIGEQAEHPTKLN